MYLDHFLLSHELYIFRIDHVVTFIYYETIDAGDFRGLTL